MTYIYRLVPDGIDTTTLPEGTYHVWTDQPTWDDLRRAVERVADAIRRTNRSLDIIIVCGSRESLWTVERITLADGADLEQALEQARTGRLIDDAIDVADVWETDTPRRPGRPRTAPEVAVKTKLTAGEVADLDRRAEQQGISREELIRRAVRAALTTTHVCTVAGPVDRIRADYIV